VNPCASNTEVQREPGEVSDDEQFEDLILRLSGIKPRLISHTTLCFGQTRIYILAYPEGTALMPTATVGGLSTICKATQSARFQRDRLDSIRRDLTFPRSVFEITGYHPRVSLSMF
jgi:hypothetical protein